MTTYPRRSEINQNTAKMDVDDRRQAAGLSVTDPSPARDFAAQCLWSEEVRALPFATASDLGVLALTLVSHVLSPLKATAKRDGKAAQEALLELFKSLPVPDAKSLNTTVTDLKTLTAAFRLMLEGRSGKKGFKLNGQYFGASVTAFQTGYDGHWITREAALRLRLVRYFEKTSGEFAKCLARAMAALSRNGTAYAAWSAGWPVFVCDLNNTLERYAAQELMSAARGEVAVVTKPLTIETQATVAKWCKGMVIIRDEAGLLHTLLGGYGTVMLLEKRIGGWTLTFPAGGAAEGDLKNKKYPGFARALSRCAQLPASLSAPERAGGKGKAGKTKHTGPSEKE